MFETEEQCQACDYRQACYQCPAGNADTGPKLFRPDDMCQNIVKLYLDLQDDVNKKIFMREYQNTLTKAEQYGFDKFVASSLTMLGRLYLNNENIPMDDFLSQDIKDYKKITAWFYYNLDKPARDSTDVTVDFDDIDVVQLYQKLMDINGLPAKTLPTTGPAEDMFYLNLIGQFVINERLDLRTKGMTTRLID